MFSRKFVFSLFINYAYICTCIKWHVQFSNSSLGYHHVVWNGKTNIQTKKVYWPKRKISQYSLKWRLGGVHVNLTFALSYDSCMNYTCSVCIARAENRAEHKRYCKRRLYMKHHPNGKIKNIMVFSALANSLLIGEFRISFIFTYFLSVLLF